MAVDWGSVLAGVVPVVVGIFIGFLLTPLQEAWSNRRRRRRLMAVLAPEVATICSMAEESVKAHEKSVVEARESLQKTGPPMRFLATNDVDYPTRVYDTHLADVDLLGEGLALSLTSLYRWTAIAHHWKRQQLEYYQEFVGVARSFEVAGVPVSKGAESYLRTILGPMVTIAEHYLRVQRRIVLLAQSAGEELSRASGQSVPKVDLSLGENLTGSFP